MMWNFLLLTLAACLTVDGQSDGLVSAAGHPFSSDTRTPLNSYFDFGRNPCSGPNCGGYETWDTSDSPSYVPGESGEDYEPQHPEHPHTDIPLPILCNSIIDSINGIESRHPDIAPVKSFVINLLFTYTWMFSAEENDNCDPAIKLLDIIMLAAEKLKKDLLRDVSSSCEYTEMPATMDPTEKPVYSSTDYDHTKEATSYPDVTEAQSTTTGYVPPKKPCPEGTEKPETTTEKYEPETEVPCPEKPTVDYIPTEEIIAEEDDYEHPFPPFIGSVRGIPGEHYPNYTEVPITTFSCAEQKYVPGFYADLETGCQVFHVCYEHRRESFLCPIGTIFNQPILACDYWYSSNCSLAPTYYEVNAKTEDITKSEEMDSAVGELITSIIEGKADFPEKSTYEDSKLPEHALEDLVQFLPVKAKVTVFTKTTVSEETKYLPPVKPVVQDVEEVASDIFDNIMSTATRVASKTRDVIAKIPEPMETEIKEPISFKPDLVKPYVPAMKFKAYSMKPKAKLAGKIAVMKAALPIAAKVKLAVPVAKIVAAKAAIPLAAKAKLAAAVPIAKVVATKAAVPVIVKAKVVAAKAAIPLVAKAKFAAAVPIAKVVATKAAVPIIAKAKVAAAVPVAKVIAAKAIVPAAAKAKLVAPVLAKSKLAAGKVIFTKAAIPVVAKKAKLAVAVPAAKVVAAKAASAKVVGAKGLVAKGKIAAAVKVPYVKKAKLVAVKAPVLKTKLLGASIPFAKAAVLKSTLPIYKAKFIAPAVKAKIFKSASVPIVKGKLLALPLAKAKFAPILPFAKAKLVKAAAISPLTKKALALGYMKLLKAKKLAFLG